MPKQTGPVTGRLSDRQLSRFTAESIQAGEASTFDPHTGLDARKQSGPAEVAAVDIGGDKIVSALYTYRDGVLSQAGAPLVRRGAGGSGYIEVLEATLALARTRSLPIGISYAGPVQGTRVLAGVNVPEFMRDLHARFDADFRNMYPRTALVNDGEAGVLAVSLEMAERHRGAMNLIYVINGSGLNAAALKGDRIITTESGHIAVEDELNPFGQRRPCEFPGMNHVCLENVAASKAGVEDLWGRLRGRRLSGKQIARAYTNGDELAAGLYEGSALITAHIVMGAANVLDLVSEWDTTVVAGHGGIFHVHGYGDAVRAILESAVGGPVQMMFTKDFSANTCLDGAAVAALRAESPVTP